MRRDFGSVVKGHRVPELLERLMADFAVYCTFRIRSFSGKRIHSGSKA